MMASKTLLPSTDCQKQRREKRHDEEEWPTSQAATPVSPHLAMSVS